MAASTAKIVSDGVESLAELIKQRRGVLRLTQEQLADAAKVHVATVHRIESGRTGHTRMRGAVQTQLAQALQISTEQIVAACKGKSFKSFGRKVCLRCWGGGCPPDSRWCDPESEFCFRCGKGLTDKCPQCSKEIYFEGTFCPHCAAKY